MPRATTQQVKEDPVSGPKDPKTGKAAKTAKPLKKTTVKKSADAKSVTALTLDAPMPRPNEKLRARTRAKLIAAARVVMGRRGIEAAVINDITSEAGLAFGSFYNYFSSKEEIAREVFVEDTLALADMLDSATPPNVDIAVTVAINIRKSLKHGLSDPIWGWFLVQLAHSINDLVRTTLGQRLTRDLTKGVESGRFVISDVESTTDCIIGGFLYYLRQILEGKTDASSIESVVEFWLCGLGISRKEAVRIAHSPL